MAKVVGPLMSMTASGTINDLYTFSSIPTTQTVRIKRTAPYEVTPARARYNALVGFANHMVRHVNRKPTRMADDVTPDKELIQAAIPQSMRWNQHITKILVAEKGLFINTAVLLSLEMPASQYPEYKTAYEQQWADCPPYGPAPVFNDTPALIPAPYFSLVFAFYLQKAGISNRFGFPSI